MYGQNMDHAVMMGGYATVLDTTSTDTSGSVEYVPYNVFSAWLDVHTNGKFKVGLFAGISQNLGTKEEIIPGTQVGRWIGTLSNGKPTAHLHSMMRVAPRVSYTSGKTTFAFELEYGQITYAKGDPNGTTTEEVLGYDEYGKVTSSETADNVKALFSVIYKF